MLEIKPSGDSIWETIIEKLFYMWEKSILISGTLAIGLVFTACYLWATEKTVAQELYLLLGVVVGFFFGAKVENASASRS